MFVCVSLALNAWDLRALCVPVPLWNKKFAHFVGSRFCREKLRWLNCGWSVRTVLFCQGNKFILGAKWIRLVIGLPVKYLCNKIHVQRGGEWFIQSEFVRRGNNIFLIYNLKTFWLSELQDRDFDKWFKCMYQTLRIYYLQSSLTKTNQSLTMQKKLRLGWDASPWQGYPNIRSSCTQISTTLRNGKKIEFLKTCPEWCIFVDCIFRGCLWKLSVEFSWFKRQMLACAWNLYLILLYFRGT